MNGRRARAEFASTLQCPFWLSGELLAFMGIIQEFMVINNMQLPTHMSQVV